MKLKVSNNVHEKLNEREISDDDIEETFGNRLGAFLMDDRERNRTKPPTQWFIAETHAGRRLKVCFIFHKKMGEFEIKTAYEPDDDEERLYEENQ